MDQVGNGRIAWMASPSVGLIRVNAGKPVSVHVTGPIAGYYVHWDSIERRTLPCFVSNCPRCRAGHSRRAMRYVRVMHYRSYQDKWQWLPGILEVPYQTGELLLSLLGVQVCLKRDRKYGPVDVGRFLFPIEPPKPVMFDMVPMLLRLWRVPDHAQVALIGNAGMLAEGLLRH